MQQRTHSPSATINGRLLRWNRRRCLSQSPSPPRAETTSTADHQTTKFLPPEPPFAVGSSWQTTITPLILSHLGWTHSREPKPLAFAATTSHGQPPSLLPSPFVISGHHWSGQGLTDFPNFGLCYSQQ